MKRFAIAVIFAAACARHTAATAPVEINQGLQTPESVLWDPQQDVYFVSNVNGDPLAEDGNGFISRVNPDTLKIELKWVDGSKQGSHLDAPKGMAIVGDELWVADINQVKKFDRRSGAPKGNVASPGAAFLNDLASDGTTAYVSDTGMGKGTDAVWQIRGNEPVKIASGTDLKEPNGLDIVNGRVWVVTYSGNELYDIESGKKANVARLPSGTLDGLVHLPDGTFLVASWDSSSVYRGPAAGPFNAVITGVKSPADIGYDSKRRRVLVPHFMENRVTIHPLQ